VTGSIYNFISFFLNLNYFFFHYTCLASKKTKFFTMSVAYDFFLMRLTAGWRRRRRRRVGMCGGGGGGLFGCNYERYKIIYGASHKPG
jgi:hypothetical protein